MPLSFIGYAIQPSAVPSHPVSTLHIAFAQWVQA
jgi:hypothetical protein